MTKPTLFLALLTSHGLPRPVAEFRFHPVRRWRFDFAWPMHKVALEVNGGVWTQGRHTRGAGAIKDMEKQNAAAVLGWRMLYTTPSGLCSGATVDLLIQILREAA